ncbi:hypothetical protein CH372_19920, partial [Leptospira meyeri]
MFFHSLSKESELQSFPVIQILINSLAGKTVALTQKTTDSLLKGIQVLVKGSLTSAGGGLDLLSNAFFYKPE